MIIIHDEARKAFYAESRVAVQQDELAQVVTVEGFLRVLERLAALATQPATSQEGEWITIPREPTEAMIQAVWNATLGGSLLSAERAARAMLAAAPAPEMDICPKCDGSGVGVADTVCSLCDGSGGAPLLEHTSTPPANPRTPAYGVER